DLARSAAAAVPEANFPAGERSRCEEPRRVLQMTVLTQHSCLRVKGDGAGHAIGDVNVRVDAQISEVLHFPPNAVGLALILDGANSLIQFFRSGLHGYDQIQLFTGWRHDGRTASG